MSAAPMSFSGRRGLFPFCPSEVGGISAGMDYVDFPAEGDDVGLAAAMRFFWLLERIEFAPSGTFSRAGNDYPFTMLHGFPEPGTPPAGYYISYYGVGSLFGRNGVPFANESSPKVEPVGRQCVVSGYVLDGESDYIENSPGTAREDARVVLLVRFVSGVWRLYYGFNFGSGNLSNGWIGNPAGVTGLPEYELGSGTFTLAGMTLDWVARSTNESTESVGVALGISVSEIYWEF